VLRRLADDGAEAVIPGCTKTALVVGPDDSTVPLSTPQSCMRQARPDMR